MKIDLHVHSKYSKDSILDLNILRKLYFKKKIVPIITDHNTIKGNKKFKCKILAEEIRTKDGEIIGLFLTEEIKPFLSIEETLDILKQQDALVMIPHPFDNIRRSTLKKVNFKPDIIEIFNSRTIDKDSNKKALNFANKNKTLKAVGSDAHTIIEIGNAYNIIEDFNSKKEFLKNLKKAEFSCKRSSLIIHPYGKLIRYIKKLQNLF
jgi:predicted metal-dependent phosphoesterase TrpH